MFKDYFKKYKSKNADLSDIYNLKGGNPQTNQKVDDQLFVYTKPCVYIFFVVYTNTFK